MLKFALAGNPNCGKTTLFNSLTGSTAHVGNWPGVTVDKREGVYKKYKKDKVSIIDLPGIYSLSPYTDEEVIARNYILNENPDCIINIVDATNLERNLYLTTQLLEMDVPIVVALNLMDEVEKKGDKIDISVLSQRLGVPVVPISALKNKNFDNLINTCIGEVNKGRKGKSVLENSSINSLINEVSNLYAEKEISNPLFRAIKLIETDSYEENEHKDFLDAVNKFKGTFSDEVFGNDLEAFIADYRYKVIVDEYSPTYIRKDLTEKGLITKSEKIDRILTNKWASIPIFLVILFVIFHITFSEDLLYLGQMGAYGFKDITSFPNSDYFAGLFSNETGVNSPGVILQTLVEGITTWINEGIRTLLTMSSNPSWVASNWMVGFICDGVLAGLFAVIGFLPQILLLFLFFSILEDTGYMARVAFILDRLFRKFGLTGRAFIPMIMGFGCSVPAMINTRTLSSDREKIETIRVIPFFSCGAKLPILSAIAGGIAVSFGFGNADLITILMYILGMAVAIITLLIMRHTSMRGELSPFIMELPAYHLPQAKSLFLHLWDKAKHFIKKAFTIILLSTIIVWLLSHVTFSWQFLDTEEQIDKSILGSLGSFIQPLFTPLGFGSQLNNNGWVFSVSALNGLIAKENVISTFQSLATSIGGSGESELTAAVAMISHSGITWQGCVSYIAFNMTTIPCFAAVATAKGELPQGKFISTLGFWLITSYIVSTFIYLVLSFWWTIFIFLVIFALGIFGIIYYNKYRDGKVLRKEN